MKSILMFCAVVWLGCSVVVAQDAPKNFDLPEPSLGTIDESQLVQRIDDLTEAVNTHTDQISELDKRLQAIEDRPAVAAWNTTPASTGRSLLNSTLKSTVPVRASGGSTGNARGQVVSSYVVSSPVVQSYEYVEEQPVIYTQPSYVAAPMYVGNAAPTSATVSYNAKYGTAATTRRGLGSRLGNFLRGGNCPDGNCPN